MYLVLLETSGNQNFIFASNKLRENIGASELIYRSCTTWILEVVEEINQHAQTLKSDRLVNILNNSQLNPPIESPNSKVEIIIAASGKSLLLTKTEEDARVIISKVTQKALKETNGIDICGVYVFVEDWEKPESKSLALAIKKVYQKFELVHGRIPSPSLRFLRLPVVAECSTSGLPAARLYRTPDNEKEPISAVSFAKREASEESLTRMGLILREDHRKFAKNVNFLEKTFQEQLKWLAIVHADGNGLGQIFREFEKYVTNNRDYVDKLRRFSLALDLCTQEAFKEALAAFCEVNHQTNLLPIVPLVLGGDDLTVICDGECALDFTHKFLTAFEEATNRKDILDGIIPEIAQQAINSDRLSACAGVAIIKPHFPFAVGYELAESLLKSAKETKRKVKDRETHKPLACSALDFHIVYDSSGVELRKIRQRLELPEEQVKLYKRPFIVTAISKLNQAQETGVRWAEFHHWEKFSNKVEFLLSKNSEGKPNFPPNQANNLRSACFLGKQQADAEYKLVKQRYGELKTLEGVIDSIFEQDQDNNHVTSFIDALDAVDFLRKT